MYGLSWHDISGMHSVITFTLRDYVSLERVPNKRTLITAWASKAGGGGGGPPVGKTGGDVPQKYSEI